jgi:hypothetical protein
VPPPAFWRDGSRFQIAPPQSVKEETAKSSVEFRFYPATSMDPLIAEDGKFLSHWLENLFNNTLVCFHSRRIERMSDGRLQATGELAITRVDRNVEANPSDAYAGPLSGPPMIHRASHEATFVLDFPAADGKESKASSIQASASTSMFREDFPQLVRTALVTCWPPLVRDEHRQVPDANGAYSGSRCSGTYLSTAGLPEAPRAASGEDVGVEQNFNSIVGNHLTILLHLRLMANAAMLANTKSGRGVNREEIGSASAERRLQELAITLPTPPQP